MGMRTALFEAHTAAGAKIVDFGGWDMPLNYGSQLDEHFAVRRQAGLFDVSHMTVVDLSGAGTRGFLSELLANDVAKLTAPGKALYSCMLNEAGGVIDDLIVYSLPQDEFRIVVNAATRVNDLAWINARASRHAVVVTERPELAMIAVQGPQARELAATCIENGDALLNLKPFHAASSGEYFVARTGYTGEDGWEILCPQGSAVALWTELIRAGALPCGLGARDTLRLEAALNLYGSDMDQTTTPYESNLAWTVSLDSPERQFVGRAALEQQRRDGIARQLVGLLLEGKGVLRNHQRVITDKGDGEITSGGYSPSLSRSIALARVPVNAAGRATVEIRNRELAVSIVKPPFVRNGKPNIAVSSE